MQSQTNSTICSFIHYLEAEKRYSKLTVRNYSRDVIAFSEWMDGIESGVFPHSVTAHHLREWVVMRSESGRLSAGSLNREIASLRSFFGWMHRTGQSEKDVSRQIKSVKTGQRLPVFVPESRIDTLLAVGFGDDFQLLRDQLIIMMFYACGLRLAELIAVDRDHFADDYRSLKVMGKGGRERIVPIINVVRKKILLYLSVIERQNICTSEEKALFLTIKGARMSRSGVYRLVRREMTAAGVQGRKSPHVLRHTFATHLLNNGADMREIQELLGHTSLQATQIYTHNNIARLQDAYSKAHPREQGSGQDQGQGHDWGLEHETEE